MHVNDVMASQKESGLKREQNEEALTSDCNKIFYQSGSSNTEVWQE